MKASVRLKLLRRTLRERRVLAQYVRELKVPNLHSEPGLIVEETINVVASIVMACPDLERLVGFHHIYNHDFDRLTHALSTRRNLKEHIWIIGDNDAITQRSYIQLPPGLMDNEQVDNFLFYHTAWSSLTTLFLHRHNHGILEHDMFIEVFQLLPALQHLCVSNFEEDDFNDTTLQYLPPLQSLRLQDLPGITDYGLTRFASAPSSQTILRLSLINLEIESLTVISKLLAYLSSLTRFTLSQTQSPEVFDGELILQPFIASLSLETLHWDILHPFGAANENLAQSILANGFPALRNIRAPSDQKGLLQMLCKPTSQIVLPSDKYSSAHRNIRAGDPEKYVRTLHAARQAAQERLEEARKTIQFQVVVEEDGVVQQTYDFNGFVGTIGSKINYVLRPDVPLSDDAVVDFKDLMDASREASGKDGCTGMWNASHPVGKKWWAHAERYRYKGVDLEKFF